VYTAVAEKEIIMPQEHEGELGENYTWKEMMKRLPHADAFLGCKTKAYDLDIFMTHWRLFVTGYYFIFETVIDVPVIETKSLHALEDCITVAGHYGRTEILDKILSLLYRLTGLSSQLWFTTNVVVDLSQNRKTQSSLSMVFNIVRLYGNYLKESWIGVFDVTLTLLIFRLLPDKLLSVHESLAVFGPLLGKPLSRLSLTFLLFSVSSPSDNRKKKGEGDILPCQFSFPSFGTRPKETL
jgi:golgi-specific brefeldin A-resistance guanine nucleotide exchange factor 1